MVGEDFEEDSEDRLGLVDSRQRYLDQDDKEEKEEKGGSTENEGILPERRTFGALELGVASKALFALSAQFASIALTALTSGEIPLL